MQKRRINRAAIGVAEGKDPDALGVLDTYHSVLLHARLQGVVCTRRARILPVMVSVTVLEVDLHDLSGLAACPPAGGIAAAGCSAAAKMPALVKLLWPLCGVGWGCRRTASQRVLLAPQVVLQHNRAGLSICAIKSQVCAASAH